MGDAQDILRMMICKGSGIWMLGILWQDDAKEPECSLLIAHCSMLIAQCSMLNAQCSNAQCSLLMLMLMLICQDDDKKLLRYERQICRGRAAAARKVLSYTESHFVASKVLLFVCLFVYYPFCLFVVCLFVLI